ncbi:MAG: IS256 family transposase [Tunicatimonas sp.]|uniref:IS256 family transposase n=1 Tax=Tunicatimonas sp. TaxID=1940096 RepID=UPI003C7592CA
MDTVKEWQTRPLDALYLVLWLDGIRFRVKEGSQYKTKVIYLVIGLNMLGHKEVLGMWLDLTESASFWMKVLDDLKQRGVERVFIGCMDNLVGFSEAIQAVFPDCLTQLCIVHQVRNSLKHVAWGERKDFAQDLKKIYTATNKQAGEEALLEVEEKWSEKYPHVFRSWTSNWERLSVFYEFPAEIRKMVYTTNIIENLNRVIRKYTKGKTVFPSDDAVQKAVFLAVEHISKKWSMPVRHWQKILAQFAILYPDKIKLEI